MKKGLLMLVILAMFTALMSGCSTSSYSGTNISKKLTNDHWEISASALNGHFSRNIDLTSDNVSAIHVENKNSDGKVSLTITQGDTVKTLDINGEYNANIDMSDFELSKVNFRLDIEDAKDINVLINWK